MRPPITGDTAKGKSINVTRICLPRNLNLVITHAAATPNIVFNGTVIAATIKVNLSADNASGFVIASTYTPKPFFKASVNTTTSGKTINQHNTRTAAPIKIHFTTPDSFVARFLTV
ncbi:hypothetical protein D3C75_893770 [compost metagenome]